MSWQPANVTHVIHHDRDNGVGLAGFVVSIIGLLSCGSLSIIGLLISLCGLVKQPRGMAIAGTIIGALGSAFFALWGMAIVTTLIGFNRAVDASTKERTQSLAHESPVDRPKKVRVLNRDQEAQRIVAARRSLDEMIDELDPP